MRLQCRPHVGSDMCIRKLKIEALQDSAKHDFGLDLREGSANTVARAAAERQEGIGGDVSPGFHCEAVRVKSFGFRPIAPMAMG